MAGRQPGTHYHRITDNEKELATKAKSAKLFLRRFRKEFPDSERSDSSIKSIWNNRHKWIDKPAIKKEGFNVEIQQKIETATQEFRDIQDRILIVQGQILEIDRDIAKNTMTLLKLVRQLKKIR